MLKNFSPAALGINGRQSELIELALTYGFTGMDVDMHEMLRRAQRTNVEDAAKYLRSGQDLKWVVLNWASTWMLTKMRSPVSLVGLHPIADLAKQLGATRGYIRVPAATNRLPYHEYFDVQGTRLGQLAQVLEPRGIKLGIGFSAGKSWKKTKSLPSSNVEGYLALVNSVAGENVGMLLDTWGLGGWGGCYGSAQRSSCYQDYCGSARISEHRSRGWQSYLQRSSASGTGRLLESRERGQAP